MNPKLLGVRLDMLLYLYRRRVRAHPVAELLAGAGVAVGVALVFGVLLANASLTGSASRVVHALAGSARFALLARSSQGMSERVVQEAGELEDVQVAAPVLRENVTLSGPHGEQAVQLIGLTPSLEALGGASTQELGAGAVLLKGGVGLPAGVAAALGARRGSTVNVAGYGGVSTTAVRVVLSSGLSSVSASPVAVASLSSAQRLAGRSGRVSELLVRPAHGRERGARRELARIAAVRHLDLRPASQELRLLDLATRPNRQSTTLFTAIAVMIGFLLALNAMLLTVPERRRFVAELRMQGYDHRQIALLLAVQALALGAVASLAGLALGDLLARVFFQQVPGFLTAAFPIGAEEVVRAWTVAAAVGCGVAASALASLSPLLDLRSGRAADGVFAQALHHSEAVRARTANVLGFAGLALVALACLLALAAASLTIAAGVALALAGICVVPAMLRGLAWLLPRAAEGVRSSALIVALAEMRTTTTRSVALAAVVALAVYGGIAIGGARRDLLRGVAQATRQYFGTASVWVTSGRDVFDTNSFPAAPAAARIARAPGVASVRVYRGGLLDVGERRMWVRARAASDGAMLESSQLVHGGYAAASRALRSSGWAAVSNDFAEEHGLKVGEPFALPTPGGTAWLRVAAITTNAGWPAGTLTLSARDYTRLWGSTDAAALEVSLKRGVSADAGRRAVLAALGPGTGLQVRTASERAAQSAASARQGLRTLGEISTLLLLAAALSVASALSAAIWQRRLRLAGLKMQGYDAGQLWRAVFIESAITLAAGALVGAVLGVAGHALASRFLQLTTGFPAPFAVGLAQALLTIALFAAAALAAIALPGIAAARVSPRAALQE